MEKRKLIENNLLAVFPGIYPDIASFLASSVYIYNHQIVTVEDLDARFRENPNIQYPCHDGMFL